MASGKAIKMLEVLRILKGQYPEAHCFLDHDSPFQLLVATILSAQCTDERVNKVTPALFEKYPDAQAMAKAPVSKIEKLIQSTGFFRNKAKSIVGASKAIVKDYHGDVPRDMESLTKLPGVGRKTANVVLGNAYQIPGLVVDTHVGRLCRRLGFTKETDPEKVEAEMMPIVPKPDWTPFSHLLISHGRATCKARSPSCDDCVLDRLCPKIL